MSEVKKITLDSFQYHLMNHNIRLNNFVVYVSEEVNSEDFDINSTPFQIPKFETARATLVLMLSRNENLKFNSQDKKEGIVKIYKTAAKESCKTSQCHLSKQN